MVILLAESNLLSFIGEAKKSSVERKFKESIDMSFNLKDVDLSDPKNRINEEIILPKGRGKEIRVGFFGSQEMQAKVKEVADVIYGPEDLAKFSENKKSFKKVVETIDYFVAESTLMATIGKTLGPVLGPRGKIPKPVPPGQDPSAMINALKRTVRARSRDRRTFHVPVGTKEMPDQDLADNITAVVKRLVGKLEKGYGNIESAYLKTTMGKAVQVKLEGIR